jgi:hypothetical protein
MKIADLRQTNTDTTMGSVTSSSSAAGSNPDCEEQLSSSREECEVRVSEQQGPRQRLELVLKRARQTLEYRIGLLQVLRAALLQIATAPTPRSGIETQDVKSLQQQINQFEQRTEGDNVTRQAETLSWLLGKSTDRKNLISEWLIQAKRDPKTWLLRLDDYIRALVRFQNDVVLS